jgi:hypothetical protein
MHAALGIEQLVLGLLIVGFREINLIGLPFEFKSPWEVLLHHGPYKHEVAHRREVTSHWGLRWVQIADPRDVATDYDVVMVSRTALLPGHVIGQVSTVNGQPGPLPVPCMILIVRRQHL